MSVISVATFTFILIKSHTITTHDYDNRDIKHCAMICFFTACFTLSDCSHTSVANEATQQMTSPEITSVL